MVVHIDIGGGLQWLSRVSITFKVSCQVVTLKQMSPVMHDISLCLCFSCVLREGLFLNTFWFILKKCFVECKYNQNHFVGSTTDD